MRLPRFRRQVVLGVDDLRRLALRPRQRLEGVAPLRTGAQVEAGQVFRLALPRLLLLPGLGRSRADPRSGCSLRHQRKRERWVPRHPLDDRHERLDTVPRSHHPFQRVAVRAATDGSLLFIGAGKACEPLRVRELGRHIVRLTEFQIGGGRFLGDDRRRGGALEVVADRADAESILARLEPRPREAITPLAVADDGRRQHRAGPGGADKHPFHRALVGGSDQPGQGVCGLSVEGTLRRPKQHDREASDRRHQRKLCPHTFPSNFEVLSSHFLSPAVQFMTTVIGSSTSRPQRQTHRFARRRP